MTPPTPIESVLVKIIAGKRATKIMSQIHKCLQSHMSILKVGAGDECYIIRDETWEDVCEGGHKVSTSPLWKEFKWKLKIWYFRTPFIVSKYNRNKETSLCWRECKQIGDHTIFAIVQN